MGLHYGARRLGAWRNPFPVLTSNGSGIIPQKLGLYEGRGPTIAKSAVLQAYRGFVEGRSAEATPILFKSQTLALERADFTQIHDGNEHEDALKVPVTNAYARACRDVLLNRFHLAKERFAHAPDVADEEGEKEDKWEFNMEAFSATVQTRARRLNLEAPPPGKHDVDEQDPGWMIEDWIFLLIEIDIQKYLFI